MRVTRFLTTFAPTLILLIIISGCKTHEPHNTHKGWSYSGATGPQHWAELSPSYAVAKNGKRQSPINIKNATSASQKLDIKYASSSINLVNNGHTVQQNVDSGSKITVDGKAYTLLQFHFHTPSEHKVKNNQFDLEMHLVHQNDQGALAVIGILYKQGTQNSFLETFWEHLPRESGKTTVKKESSIHLKNGLPKNLDCYCYDGSLTTPPCTEGVKWFVMEEIQELSASQLTHIQSIVKDNFRPIQPLNGRSVKKLSN